MATRKKVTGLSDANSTAEIDPNLKFVLGLDFGTLSGRAVLINVDTGEEVATAIHEYSHGVIEETLPGDTKKLAPSSALQDPQDYLDVLATAIPAVLKKTKVKPSQVIGIGTDFTTCTMLPCTKRGIPLCFLPEYRDHPHAWVKLWKHHSAQSEADEINQVGAGRCEEFIRAYGGKYSSEWLFSKLLETLRKAPEIYDAADRFIEAGDWLVWQLTGQERRSACLAGFKAMWVYPYGEGWAYPSHDFFKDLDPRLENVIHEKLSTEIFPLGTLAGGLSPTMARITGLKVGTPVAVSIGDAHAAVPACTVTEAGKMVMIMGTSLCHMALGSERRLMEGICGVVKDGIVTGTYGFEAGQSAVGDIFGWFFEQNVPEEFKKEADRKKTSVPQLLEEKSAKLAVGEAGILALDWWNGNRSVLGNANLSGLIVGLTLQTKPHEIYRALMEATAFGTRRIIDAFVNQGIEIRELYACGGLAERNHLLMQIYADVTGRTIKVAKSSQTCALGAAMYGAVAAGYYPNIQSAAQKMAGIKDKIFVPNEQNRTAYHALYDEYLRLHDLFGYQVVPTMKNLKKMRSAAHS